MMTLQRSLTAFVSTNSEEDNGLSLSSENVTKSLLVGETEYYMTECQQDNDGTNIVEIAASIFGIVIAVFNVLVLTLIIRDKRLHKATFFCICNMAAADLLAGLMLLWIFCLQKFLPFRSPLSDLIQKSVLSLSVWASLLNQLVIAVDKFCLIRSRQLILAATTWGSTKRKWWIIFGLLMTWMVPILTFVVPVSATWNCANNCTCYKPVNDTTDVIFMFCFPLDQCSLTNPPFTKASMLYMGVFLVVMPIAPCVLYMKIFNRARISAQRSHSNHAQNSIATNSGDQELHNLRTSANLASQSDDYVGSASQNLDVPSLSLNENKSLEYLHSQDGSAVTASPNMKKIPKKLSNKNLISLLNTLKKKSASNDPTSTHQHGRRRSNFNLRKSSSAFLTKTFNIGKREVSLLRTLVLILGCYIVSTVPLGILFIMSFQDTDKRYVIPSKGLIVFSLSNSFLNPIIYMWRFKDMRKGVRKMLCCKGDR